MINSHTELNNQMDIVRRHTVPVITHPHPARVGSGSRTIRLCVEDDLPIRRGRAGFLGSRRRRRHRVAGSSPDSWQVMCSERPNERVSRRPPNVFLAQGANYWGLIDSIGNTNEFLWHTLLLDPDMSSPLSSPSESIRKLAGPPNQPRILLRSKFLADRSAE